MKPNLIQGDCRAVLSTLPEQSFHTCVTSPPYFGLRDYGSDDQIGLEQTPDAFVAELVAVFREVRRVLRDDGTLWLNLGDSYNAYNAYNANRGASTSISDGTAGRDHPKHRKGLTTPTLKNKDLIGIPWRVAFALQADGWYLRQDIIWHKPNPMPESVRDRCTKAHEYMFLLSKAPRYYFDSKAMQEPAAKGAAGSTFNKGKTATHQMGRSSDKDRSDSDTRNRRSVWPIATHPYRGAHFATFPPDLIEPCILAGAPPGGHVLDPFNGAGTTGLVALKHGRSYTGIELNPDYLEIARQRIEKADRLRREVRR
jgi:site-specific DNA-methyltransferase (adenine-specific)